MCTSRYDAAKYQIKHWQRFSWYSGSEETYSAYRLHDLIYDLASKLADERKPNFWYTSGSIRKPDKRMTKNEVSKGFDMPCILLVLG